MKSVRSTIFKRFPRTQIPDFFYSWEDYAKYVELLVRTNSIDDGKKIWWDIRPHAYFKTLEFRICDIPCRAEETIAIAAVTQALVAKLHRLFESEPGHPELPACDPDGEQVPRAEAGAGREDDRLRAQLEEPTRALVHEVLDFVDDVVDELAAARR